MIKIRYLMNALTYFVGLMTFGAMMSLWGRATPIELRNESRRDGVIYWIQNASGELLESQCL
jgi:hypothetical protein